MAIAYHGKASTPADAGSNDASPTAITPPTCTTGDLVVVQCSNRLNSDTHDVSNNGGQSWTKLSTVTSTLVTTTWFYCVYDGTWDANPSFSHGGTNNTCMMLVFTPTSTYTWGVDVAEAPTTGAAPTTPFDITVTGITCAAASVMIVGVFSRDDNTWAYQSGGATMPAGCSVNNMAGSDSGMLMAYKLMAAGGATGDQVIRQSANGGDVYTQNILSFKESAPAATTQLASVFQRDRIRIAHA